MMSNGNIFQSLERASENSDILDLQGKGKIFHRNTQDFPPPKESFVAAKGSLEVPFSIGVAVMMKVKSIKESRSLSPKQQN